MAERPIILFLGFGYIAAALGKLMTAKGWRAIGTTRSGDPLPGAEIVPFSGGAPSAALWEAAACSAAVLSSIPPGEDGDPGYLALQELWRATPPAWTGYLSTTGVYGDRQGGWAFEEDPPTPQSPEARRRRLAEGQWLSLPRPAHVFRLPGIYGPGRSSFDRLRAGGERRIDKPGQVFSRIHRDDAATALALSIASPHPGRIYNVCDDAPASSAEVTAYAAGLLGSAPPPLVSIDAVALSPMAQRFYSENKRVSNARLKAELGWRPAYPTFREGLAMILQAERSSAS